MNREEFVAAYPWREPDKAFKTVATTVAIQVGGAHKSVDFIKVIHTNGLDHIDDTDWELFTVSHENEDFIWGMFVEGIGAFNIMVPKAFVRHLTDDEYQRLNGRRMVMVGSHTGKVSQEWSLKL